VSLKIVSSTLLRESLVKVHGLINSEFANSPNIAIIQHESAVMQVVGHFFENGITSFTTRINSAISFCAANGEVAPFVGHNAFLRWTAIQDASFIDEDDGIRKCWSESHVSEDFDQALRLQMKGWSLRWASYSNGGFQEGVSLTADDEVSCARNSMTSH
jgi:membrane glycosyltransferase